MLKARSKIFPNDQNGYSLIEILVATGVLSIILYIASSGLIGAFNQQSNLVSKDNASQFIASLANYMNDQALCSEEFKGQSFPLNGSRKLVLKNYKGFGERGEEITEGSQLTDNLTVSSLELIHKASVPTQSIGNGMHVYVAQVKIAVSLPAKGGVTARPSYIEFPLKVNSSRIIQGCQTGLDLSVACLALGMTLDPATDECVPQTTCTVTGTFVSTTCSPSQYGCSGIYNSDNPVTGGASCPTHSSPRLTGELIHNSSASCGKKCAVTIQNQTQFYICMRCS